MIITVSPADLAEMDNKQDSIAYYQLTHWMTKDPNGFYYTYAAKRKVIILNPEYPKVQFTDTPLSKLKDDCVKAYKERFCTLPEIMIHCEGENA